MFPTPPHRTRTSTFRFGRTKPICRGVAACCARLACELSQPVGPEQPPSLAHGETKSPRPGSSYSFGRTNPICPSRCQRDAFAHEANFDGSWPGWLRSSRSSKGASVARLSSAAELAERTQFSFSTTTADRCSGFRFCQNEPNSFSDRSAAIGPYGRNFGRRSGPLSGDLCVDAFLMTLEAREIRLFPARSFLRSSDEYRSRQSLAWVNED
jgi:hypothetical protein